jgi:hypothetical protein
MAWMDSIVELDGVKDPVMFVLFTSSELLFVNSRWIAHNCSFVSSTTVEFVVTDTTSHSALSGVGMFVAVRSGSSREVDDVPCVPEMLSVGVGGPFDLLGDCVMEIFVWLWDSRLCVRWVGVVVALRSEEELLWLLPPPVEEGGGVAGGRTSEPWRRYKVYTLVVLR